MPEDHFLARARPEFGQVRELWAQCVCRLHPPVQEVVGGSPATGFLQVNTYVPAAS